MISMRVKYFTTFVLSLVAINAASQSIDDLYNVGKSVNNDKRVRVTKKATSTHSPAFSDSVEVQFITNVPANLKLNGEDYGEVSVRPYRLKYGQYKAEFSADGYRTKTKNIEPSRTQLSIYNIKLHKGKSDSHTGLRHELVLNYSCHKWTGYESGGKNLNSGLLDYVIGWRFNRWVFLGAGTGIHVLDQAVPYCDYYNEGNGHDGSRISVEIPFYAHAKVYFTDKKWCPFLMTSLGGRIAPERFGGKAFDAGVLFNIGPGLEYCINDRLAINLCLAYEVKGIVWSKYYKYEGFNDSGCTDYTHGFTLRAGFVIR